MPSDLALSIEHVSHRYADRVAVDDVSLNVAQGEAFAFLGPNGSGKTTLFRVLSTLIALQSGEIAVFGHDLRRDPTAARRSMGVVFQSPSLDKKLTVAENLWHQGRLYGLGRAALRERSSMLLTAFGLADRAGDRVETLSGGMRRRVEIAKCLLHRPRLLLLDEPSTGLDPVARLELWSYLRGVHEGDGTTIVVTTHYLDEADRADRIAIMDSGHVAALGRPDDLRSRVGGDAVTIQASQPERLAAAIRERFNVEPAVVDGAVRLELADGPTWIPRVFEAFGGEIQAITLGKPTLEDVFIDCTGRRFTDPQAPVGKS